MHGYIISAAETATSLLDRSWMGPMQREFHTGLRSGMVLRCRGRILLVRAKAHTTASGVRDAELATVRA